MTKKNIFFYIILFLVCAGVIISRVGAGRQQGGWKRAFGEEIAQQNANPKDFHTMTLNGSSLYVGAISGFTYSLNRINGTFQWQHEAQDYSIYPVAFGNPDRMFISNFDGGIYAIDQKSGTEAWGFRIPEYFKADTEPIVSDGFVYFGGRNGTLYALDEKTGKPQWNFQEAPLDITHYSPEKIILHFGRFSVDNKNVYLNSSNTETIYALDKQTGKEIWRFANYGFVFQKPIIFPDSISFWSNTGIYYLLNKKNGSVLYSVKAPSERVIQGNTYTYVISSDDGVECINTTNGVSQWVYKKAGFKPTQLKEVAPSRLILMGKNNAPESIATRIIMVDADTGKDLWTQIIEEPLINSIESDADNVYIIGQEIQYAYDMQGKMKWSSHEHQNGNTIIPSQDVLYLVSDDREHTDISAMDARTGSRRWTYKLPTTEPLVMEAYKGDLYFVSIDKKSVYMLNSKFPQSVIHDADIHTITDKPDSFLQVDRYIQAFINRLLETFASVSNKQPTITIDVPSKQVYLHEPYELTIHLDDTRLTNKYDDVKITGTFSNNKKDTYTIGAFYYDKNTWKIRFVPASIGKWNFTIRYDASNAILNRGSFDVSDSDKPDFISISKNDPRLFVNQNGNVFIPIGIQDCVQDNNQDGNPLNQWFTGIDSNPLAITPPYATSTMDSYLSTYAESGFNMFRWGAGNCSFPLWKTLSPAGNRYALDGGVWLDTLFSSLRNHGFHVWMSLFSFKLPLDKTLSETQQQTILSHYLDYIVARYAGYVDVWELANEIHLDDKLITFMSDYIRAIDPYHHPITTNWERPELPSVDITSLHWYYPECNNFCDNRLLVEIEKFLAINKPLVFSEQGNWFTNWDNNSAARMRIHLWIGYFEKVFSIFWNTSNSLFVNKNLGPSNIYIGPIERQYVSIFKTLTTNQTASLTPFPIKSKDKTYSFLSERQIIGYIYRNVSGETQENTSIDINVPAQGIIQWISPTTGSILSEQPVKKGSQFLLSPQFSTDILFKILFSNPVATQ